MEDMNQSVMMTHSPASTQNVVDLVEHATTGDNNAANHRQGVKRGRGRPRKLELTMQDGKRQVPASVGGPFVGEPLAIAGTGFTVHALTVNTGEDVVTKILSFCKSGPLGWVVCVLTANGYVSSVFMNPPGATDILSYEGNFQIISLTGAYTSSAVAEGEYTHKCELAVTLAKPGGGVFGGKIESSLIAASPVQVMLSTFKLKVNNKTKKNQPSGSSAAAANIPAGDGNSAPTNDIAGNVIPEIIINAVPERFFIPPDLVMDYEPAEMNMDSEPADMSMKSEPADDGANAP